MKSDDLPYGGLSNGSVRLSHWVALHDFCGVLMVHA